MNRYQWLTYGIVVTLALVGVGILAVMSFGRVILPPAIEIQPSRVAPFAHAVCPGDQVMRQVTYVVNRPSVLEIDAIVYDLGRDRSVAETAVHTSRPFPYTIREVVPVTLTVPQLPPGRYEWQLGASPKNQNSTTTWWFVEFQVREGCPPLPEDTPSPEGAGGD